MYQKDSILHPRKGDWLLMHRRDELLAIMEDNGKREKSVVYTFSAL